MSNYNFSEMTDDELGELYRSTENSELAEAAGQELDAREFWAIESW